MRKATFSVLAIPAILASGVIWNSQSVFYPDEKLIACPVGTSGLYQQYWVDKRINLNKTQVLSSPETTGMFYFSRTYKRGECISE